MNTSNYSISYEFSLNEKTKKEWHRFWSKNNHSYPHQHFMYAEVERAKKRIPIFITGRIEGVLSFIGLFSIRPILSHNYSGEAVCIRGPVFDDITFGEWCFKEIIEYMSRICVGSIRVGPNWSFPEAKNIENCLFNIGFSIYEKFHKNGRRSTGIVNINRTDEELIKSFQRNTRYEKLRAEKLNITIRPADDNNDAEVFYKHLTVMNKKRGLTPYSHNEFVAMYNYILKDKELGVILNAYHDTEYLGGLVILKGPIVAHYSKYVVLNDKMKKISNLRLAPILFWHGMIWAREKMCKYIDLEGYESNPEKAGHLQNIYEYKHGFNPEEISVLGQYAIKCNKFIFLVHLICKQWVGLSKKPNRMLFKLRVFFINRQKKKNKKSPLK